MWTCHCNYTKWPINLCNYFWFYIRRSFFIFFHTLGFCCAPIFNRSSFHRSSKIDVHKMSKWRIVYDLYLLLQHDPNNMQPNRADRTLLSIEHRAANVWPRMRRIHDPVADNVPFGYLKQKALKRPLDDGATSAAVPFENFNKIEVLHRLELDHRSPSVDFGWIAIYNH